MSRILGEDGPPHKRTMFGLNEYKGNRLFEIREHYLNKRKGEFQPTKKGVNLNRDKFLELKRVIDSNLEEILEWLRLGAVTDGVHRYQIAQEEAKQRGFRLTRDVEIEEISDFRDNHLFHVAHQGSKDVVTINLSHPFAQAISIEEIERSNPQEIRELFASVIASYARSRSLLLGASASNPEILFEQSEFDWTEFLRGSIEET